METNAQEKRYSHSAMATVFEIVVPAEHAASSGSAADAAFAEIDAVEREISRFVETSDISQINNLTPGTWVRIGPRAFECLKAARRVWLETGGAFDVTIGPLMRCWRNPDKSPRQPSEKELEAARAKVGMNLVELDEANRAVRVAVAGVQVDTGGIGKGYGVDAAVETLKEWDVPAALVNAGGSTVFAFGAPPGKPGWPVGVGGAEKDPEPAQTVLLRGQAVSGSGIQVNGRHIMDPKTGRPVMDKLAAWSMCANATEADALSTAFMVMTPDRVRRYCLEHAGASAMLVIGDASSRKTESFGAWDASKPK